MPNQNQYETKFNQIFLYASAFPMAGPQFVAIFGPIIDGFVESVTAQITKLMSDVANIKQDPKLTSQGKTFKLHDLAEKALDTITGNINNVGKKLDTVRAEAIKQMPTLPSLLKYSSDKARREFSTGLSQTDINSAMGSSRMQIELAGMLNTYQRVCMIRDVGLLPKQVTDREVLVRAAATQGDAGFEILCACKEVPIFAPLVSDAVLQEAIAGWMQANFPDQYQSIKSVDVAISAMQTNAQKAMALLRDTVGGPILEEPLRAFLQAKSLWNYVPAAVETPRSTDTLQTTTGDTSGITFLKP